MTTASVRTNGGGYIYVGDEERETEGDRGARHILVLVLLTEDV